MKQVVALQNIISAQRKAWGQEYIGGMQIASAKWASDAYVPVAIRTARKLAHAVVVTCDDEGTVRFMALPHPKESI
jgi:hypothetical protein